MHAAAFVVVAGITAERGEPIGCQRQEPLDREAPRDVFDIGVKPAVLVYHQHRRERAVAAGLDEIATHDPGIAAVRCVIDITRDNAFVGKRNRVGGGVAGQKALGHRQRRRPADGQRRRTAEEGAAVDLAMAVVVVEVEHTIIDRGFCGVGVFGRLIVEQDFLKHDIVDFGRLDCGVELNA